MMTREQQACMSAVNSGADVHDMRLRVVDYARVSTASREQRKSFENQLDTYRSMIEETPTWTYAGTYCDEAVSGTKAALRGGFQKMIEDAQAGFFDMIIVKDVARFARNIKECLVYKDKLKSCGVMVYFVKENLNSFRTRDETMLQFMALGAEMEAKSARDRTKIVFEQGIRKGKIYGNSKILGYRKDHCKLVLDETEAQTVRLIFDLYVHHRMGLRRIAGALAARGITRGDGTPIPTRTINTVLANPKYKGYFCGGKTEKLDLGEKYVRRPLPEQDWVMYRDPAVPPIVSEALWEQAARLRGERRAQFNTTVLKPCNHGIYRYSGKIESGLAVGVNYTRIDYRYKGVAREGWQCRGRKNVAKSGNVGPTLYTDELDAAVRELLRTVLGGYDALISDLLRRYQAAAENGSGKRRLAALRQECKKIAQKKLKILALYEEDALGKADFMARNKEHTAHLAAVEAEIQALQAAQGGEKTALPEGLDAALAAAVAEITPSREMLDVLLDKILVRKDSTRTQIHLDIALHGVPVTHSAVILREKKP